MPARRLPWLQDWRRRHRTTVSFWLHVLGIPLTIAAGVVAAVLELQDRWDRWPVPLALVIVGYGLQWLGHRYEGNDMGEVILIKRIFGRPYIAVAPRARREST